MRAVLLSCLYIAIICGATASQAAPETMAVKVRVDRTALYPGDRLNYIVRVEHSSGIEFVQDHVRKDQLSLEPFEILNVSSATGDLPGGRKFFDVKLLLTTYAASHPDAAVPSFNLFYFRRGQTANKETTPAETLTVPPLKIGLRSTLVDPPGNLRDGKPVLPVSQIDWMLPGILGLCGLVAVIVYASSLALAWVRSGFWKRKMSESVRKKSMWDSFEEIRQAPLDSPESVESFYAKASAILRGFATEQLGDCGGLTPREMQTALGMPGSREDHAAAVGDLMEQCDLVRYSPDGTERARACHSEFLRKFEELVERR
jgi:hypothetical protein